MDHVIVEIPKRLINFVALFYGLWCGSLWAALMGLSLFILKNKEPFWSPLWQPQTADASIAFIVLFILGSLSIVFGLMQAVRLARNAHPFIARATKAFCLALPLLVFLASKGLLSFFY